MVLSLSEQERTVLMRAIAVVRRIASIVQIPEADLRVIALLQERIEALPGDVAVSEGERFSDAADRAAAETLPPEPGDGSSSLRS